MNRTALVFATVLLTAGIGLAQGNQWDGYTSGYDGAFGLADQTSPDFTTAADIYTIQTPAAGNAGTSKALGYFRYINPVDATISLNHSFDGLLQFINPVPTGGFTIDINSDETTEIRGANAPASSDDPAAALQISGGNAKLDSYNFSQGNYHGGAGVDSTLTSADAAQVNKLDNLVIDDSNWTGGQGYSGSFGVEVKSTGGAGASINDVNMLVITNGSAVRGGNGGEIEMTASGIRATTTGGNGINLANTAPTQELIIDGSSVSGGAGGNVSALPGGSPINTDGGMGIQGAALTLTLKNAEIKGGDAGDVTAETSGLTDAVGGTAVRLGGVFGNPIGSDVTVSGGEGGTVKTTGDAAVVNSRGGDGLVIATLLNSLEITGGQYSGGNAGDITAESTTDNAVTANGGNAFAYVGPGSSSPNKVIISGGEFNGGAGGKITNPNAAALAEGGAALLFVNGGAEISDGVFNGGAAGTINGQSGIQGAGVKIQDSAVTITGGDFSVGRGLLGASLAGGNTINVSGGKFSEVEFSGNNTINISGGEYGGDFLFSKAGTKVADISNISFGELYLEDSGSTTLRFGNTIFNDIHLYGTGTRSITLSNDVTASGNVMLTGGTTSFEMWNDDHFMSTTVSEGTMTFNNQMFNLGSGDTLVLENENSAVNFNGGATIGNGATLDIGLGNVGGAGNFVTEGGSTLKTWMVDNASGGIINGVLQGGNLTFEEGTTWEVAGTAENAVDRIQLASATGTITDNGIDFDYSAERLWWLGIIGTTVESGNFYANLGDSPWNEALDAPAGSEYDKAMSELSLVVTNGTEGYDILTSITTKGEAQEITSHNWVRTAEMASSMMGFQSIIADQVKDRTRTQLRYENNGFAGVNMAPSGAAGPDSWYNNSMNWLNERLPSFGGDASDRQVSANPSTKGSGYDSTMNWLNNSASRSKGEISDVPETYQVWGRGFGSRVKQDDTRGFAGYDADIYGGIIGLDKQFNDVLAGFGAGYGSTRVEGDLGNDGDADTGFGVGYLSVTKGDLFIDASVSYGFSSVDTETYLPANAGYEGSYDAHTAGFYLGGGYGMSILKDTLLLTPEASILATYYDREGYTEKSTVYNDKKFDSYDEWSYRSAVGATLTMIKKVESLNLEMSFQPEVRVHWIHEFNDELDDESYKFVGIPGGGQSIGVALQAREEDLVRLGAGARFAKWDSSNTEVGIDVDGEIGSDYEAIIVSAKLMHRF